MFDFLGELAFWLGPIGSLLPVGIMTGAIWMENFRWDFEHSEGFWSTGGILIRTREGAEILIGNFDSIAIVSSFF